VPCYVLKVLILSGSRYLATKISSIFLRTRASERPLFTTKFYLGEESHCKDIEVRRLVETPFFLKMKLLLFIVIESWLSMVTYCKAERRWSFGVGNTNQRIVHPNFSFALTSMLSGGGCLSPSPLGHGNRQVKHGGLSTSRMRDLHTSIHSTVQLFR